MRSFRPSQATSRVVLAWLFLVVAFACGRPIELVDEGVVTVEGELPFSLDALPAEAREALRVGAELVGHGAEVTLRITDEGRLVGEVTYHVETEADVSLVVRVSGARNLAEEPVLLAEHRRTLSLVPRGEEAVTLAKGDFTTKGSAGTDAIRFDKNRNGRANLEDLLAGCAPGVPAPALAVSATDMQFSSAVVPGDYQRQVLVLDNVGDEEVSYWLRVVGAPGVFVSPLLSETLVAPVPGLALGAEGEPLTLAPGEEALVAVTFTPADSRLTTGFLVVESSDPCEVRQASSVRLIGNPDGQYAPPPSFDPGALPEPSELGIDESLPVSTAVNQHIFDGRPTTLPALPAELPAVEIQGAYARAAALLSLPSSTRLGIGLVDLATDADLYVFPVEGTTLGEPFTSIHPGTDPETLVLEPVPEARILLVVVSDAAAEAGARRVEGYTLFFRASSVPTFVPPGLSPRQGSVAGGTSVTLHGAGFRPGAQVYFAGVPASAVVVDPSGNTLTALTPPGLLLRETNPATVSVKNPAEGGAESQYATLPGGFLYLPSAPLVLALDPASGVVDEEHLVRIRGEGFTDFFGPPDVRFGGIPARSVTFVSSTELQVRAPASSTPGSVDVTVSLRGPEPDERIETTAPAAFTWVEPLPVPPTVSSISPTGAPAGRPVVIAVLGEDFAAGARVRFEPVSGGVAVSASSVTFVDENQLGAVVPGLPAGDWAVVVENPDGQRASERPVFQAYTEAGADPFVSALTPDVVHAEVAGDTLSVLGANLASRPLVGVGIEGNGQSFSASLASIVDSIASVRVDAPLPAGSGYRIRFDYEDFVVRSPPFSAEAPSLLATQVISGRAVEGEAFSLLFTGQRLFPAKLEAVRFDGPVSVTLAPASATESNVRVDVPSLVQGSYAAALEYAGGFEATLVHALYVEGDCGNGVKDALEACDLADLGGATCASLGFVGGVLSCNADCSFNTSLCNGCGNGVLEAGEECDGVDFGGATCEALGYTGGSLSCHAPTCTLSVAGCSVCGDGVAGAGEVCDGIDLRGQTCGALGFTSGTLACRDDCRAFDALGCETCGDGVCSGSESSVTCPADCAPTCGNDTCDVGEDCSTCPGDCSTCAPYHAVVVGGAAQAAFIGQPLPAPIVVRIEDESGAPVPGAILVFQAPPGGKVSGPTGATAVTNVAGEASVTVTLGFRVGTQSVVVTGVGPGGAPIEGLPLTLSHTVEDVPVGTVFTLVNRFNAAGNALDADGAAALSRLNTPRGLALDGDGSLLIADSNNHRVLRVSPAGEITRVAGNGSLSHDGELVDALSAGVHTPMAVLADGAGGFYVAATGGSLPGRIRHIDENGIIRTFAGTATDAFPDRGNGRPAIDAYLVEPWSLAWHPSGDLVVSDRTPGAQYVRRFEKGTTMTSTLMASSVVCDLDDKTMNIGLPGAIAFDGSSLYFSTQSIPMLAANVNACAPAIAYIGGQREGGTPRSVADTGPTIGLTVDAAGNLYTYSESRREIVRIDRFGRVTAVAGNGTQGTTGDSGDALAASFHQPAALVMSPSGDLYVADDMAHNVRVIRGVGQAVSPPAALELVSTPPFSAPLMRPSAAIFTRATLGGTPAGNMPIVFEILNGHLLAPASTRTDLFGEANVIKWAGLVEGEYAFRASLVDRLRMPIPGASLDLSVDGVLHPAGTIVPVVNLDNVAGATLARSAIQTRLNAPSDLVGMPDGSIVVVARINHRLVRLLTDGTVELFAGNGEGASFPISGASATEQPFPQPSALAVSGAGELFVAVERSSPLERRIYKILPSGQALLLAGGGTLDPDGVAGVSAQLPQVLSMTYDDETNTLYFSESGRLYRLGTDGVIHRVPLLVSCAPGAILQMNRIVALGEGKVAISVELNGCGGMSQFRVMLSVDVNTGIPTELSGPSLLMERSNQTANAMAVSPLSGRLYFDTRYGIYRRENDGTFTLITGTSNTLGASLTPVPAGPEGLVNDPLAFAFDTLGNLYFTEFNRHGIRMLTAPDSL